MNVEVDDTGDVARIELNADDGRRWDLPVYLDSDAFVDAAHLREHIRQRLPVRLTVMKSRGTYLVVRIDDT